MRQGPGPSEASGPVGVPLGPTLRGAGEQGRHPGHLLARAGRPTGPGESPERPLLPPGLPRHRNHRGKRSGGVGRPRPARVRRFVLPQPRRARELAVVADAVSGILHIRRPGPGPPRPVSGRVPRRASRERHTGFRAMGRPGAGNRSSTGDRPGMASVGSVRGGRGVDLGRRSRPQGRGARRRRGRSHATPHPPPRPCRRPWSGAGRLRGPYSTAGRGLRDPSVPGDGVPGGGESDTGATERGPILPDEGKRLHTARPLSPSFPSRT